VSSVPYDYEDDPVRMRNRKRLTRRRLPVVHRRMKVIVYEDEAGEFRWKLVADNGEIIADSAEGYRHRLRDHHGSEAESGC
jgi:uncharacterized protein YegP (UPF0339 family)